MGNKPLKDIKIINAVTNDLFRDRRLLRVCSALNGFGAQVTLIGIKRQNSLPLTNHGFSQKRFSMFFKSGVMFYLEYNIRLFIYLLFTKFDIINSNDTDTVLACFLAAKLKRKTIVFDAHEYFTEVPELQNRKIKKRIWQVVEEIILPKIVKNYTVSESLKKLYQDKTGQKYSIIRNYPVNSKFVELNRLKNGLSEEIIIGYVGALNKGRGLEQAIEMMSLLGESYKLLLIGGGDLEDRLRHLVKRLHLCHRVDFTGWVQPNEIAVLLSKVDIGLNLLDGNSENYRVSLANKVFDYLNLGIPCLTMNFLEYRKINDEYDCFILTDSLDIEENHTKIKAIIKDKKRYKEISLNSLKAAEEFNWKSEKQKLLKIYK